MAKSEHIPIWNIGARAAPQRGAQPQQMLVVPRVPKPIGSGRISELINDIVINESLSLVRRHECDVHGMTEMCDFADKLDQKANSLYKQLEGLLR